MEVGMRWMWDLLIGRLFSLVDCGVPLRKKVIGVNFHTLRNNFVVCFTNFTWILADFSIFWAFKAILKHFLDVFPEIPKKRVPTCFTLYSPLVHYKTYIFPTPSHWMWHKNSHFPYIFSSYLIKSSIKK